jgi:hypothetical protein
MDGSEKVMMIERIKKNEKNSKERKEVDRAMKKKERKKF